MLRKLYNYYIVKHLIKRLWNNSLIKQKYRNKEININGINIYTFILKIILF